MHSSYNILFDEETKAIKRLRQLMNDEEDCNFPPASINAVLQIVRLTARVLASQVSPSIMGGDNNLPTVVIHDHNLSRRLDLELEANGRTCLVTYQDDITFESFGSVDIGDDLLNFLVKIKNVPFAKDKPALAA
jgi:hypothetical protein